MGLEVISNTSGILLRGSGGFSNRIRAKDLICSPIPYTQTMKLCVLVFWGFRDESGSKAICVSNVRQSCHNTGKVRSHAKDGLLRTVNNNDMYIRFRNSG